MLGAFYCPHCKTANACNCESCKPFINEGEKIATWSTDGNSLVCANCAKGFTLDDACDTEYELLNKQNANRTINS